MVCNIQDIQCFIIWNIWGLYIKIILIPSIVPRAWDLVILAKDAFCICDGENPGYATSSSLWIKRAVGSVFWSKRQMYTRMMGSVNFSLLLLQRRWVKLGTEQHRSGPRPIVGFRGQEQESQTERVAEDRFGREKENNRYGHNCNFMKQDDLPLKLFWICMGVPISKYHVLFKSNKSSPCLGEKNPCGGYTVCG